MATNLPLRKPTKRGLWLIGVGQARPAPPIITQNLLHAPAHPSITRHEKYRTLAASPILPKHKGQLTAPSRASRGQPTCSSRDTRQARSATPCGCFGVTEPPARCHPGHRTRVFPSSATLNGDIRNIGCRVTGSHRAAGAKHAVYVPRAAVPRSTTSGSSGRAAFGRGACALVSAMRRVMVLLFTTRTIPNVVILGLVPRTHRAAKTKLRFFCCAHGASTTSDVCDVVI